LIKRVCVVDTGYESYAGEQEALSQEGYSFDIFEGDRLDLPAKLAFAKGATGVFVRWSEFDGPAFDQLPGLRCLVRYGIGYDNIDLKAASERGVKVCNVQGYANHTVSDHALAMILACVRNLPDAMRRVRSHYSLAPRTYVPELHELTLGIVGLGRIGGTLCTKARHLFQRVVACDPYIASERFKEMGAEVCSFDELLRESDVISLHCNLTDETFHIIGPKQFEAMRPNVIVVNTSRGPVMDEEALTEALLSGKVYGAGLDVFEDEPPKSNRDVLLAHPYVVSSGHCAWYSTPASLELQRRAARNMAAMLRGETPEDCLNAEAFRTE
jgi:D-3-phosphoglycerate dehydrogenase / 2-oxoglutarate reductase